MSLLDRLSDEACWKAFYEYKTSLCCPKAFARELQGFVERQGYRPVCEAMARGERFPLPRKSVISKMGTARKRTVYTYPPAENTVLKLLTHLLLRRYDGLYADGLYSFRPGRTAKDAIRRLRRTPGIDEMYWYKVDIHDYFNSIPVPRLKPMLEEVTRDDPRLCAFLCALLEEPCVLDGGRETAEPKGIMAGTPLSAFYADLYLAEMDRRFEALGVPYARYSDDVIVFARTRAEAEAHAAFLRAFLTERGLAVNPDKESFGGPGEGWTFLGFFCRGGTVDIAPATVTKLKQKMRRKARALQRWQKRNGAGGERAAAAFLRIFNRKLLEGPADNELTWSRWFFSVINTDAALHVIDAYAQDCVRFLLSGARTKARFRVKYEDMKKLGYRSLVHAYHAFENGSGTASPASAG